jgi:lipopolysaccharide transport system ATP-binding protein
MLPALRVEKLSKRYLLGSGPPGGRTLAETLSGLVGGIGKWFGRGRATDSPPPGPREFWALRDVSFEVQPGEAVGIIGRNGAGKSTLLKVLSRIVHPTEGRAEVRGRLGSLLEVGTGFHPELTGRENVYLNGSILGMTRREIARKFDEIVAFAGVEQFLDTPVKRYSSGMYVRLAFAVAAHLEPEILIVDEVLAVGDAEFQKKCIEKMRSVSRTGRTVLLVSHNLAQVESLCTRALTLQKGQAIGFGPAAEQVRNYLAQTRTGSHPTIDLREHAQRPPGATPILTGLAFLADGVPGVVARMNGGFGLELAYRLPRKPRDLRVGVVLENAFGVKVTTFSPTYQAPHLLDDPPAEGVVRAEIPTHTLLSGAYYVNVYAQAEGLWDAVEPAGSFEIETADVFGSGRVPGPQEAATYLPCRWSRSW